MKRLLRIGLMALTLSLPFSALGDVICLSSGEEIPAKIVTIGETEITYKKASNLTGPNYVVPRSTVFYIEFDNGQREVINSLDSTPEVADVKVSPQPSGTVETGNAGNNTTLGNLAKQSISGIEVEEKPEKRRFADFTFMPHATLGYQGTGCGMGDIEIDWGGLYANIDLNCLFASGTDTAWSVGLGFTWLQGDLAMYTGKKPKDKEWPGLNGTYIGLPIGYWYKTEYFMFGATASLDLLIRSTLNGEKAEDVFNLVRCPEKLYFGASLGLLDIGLHLGIDFISAFKGEGLSWSPTFTVGGTIGIRLGKL